MDRYTLAYAPASVFPSPFLVPPTNEALDQRADSRSGSEDGSSYIHYPDAQKIETPPEEDPNAALTSQTLNSDGTPKRPMNAFMIFARRRRPQVSTENQSMRTGEISKILSREWTSMEMVEKQFYLDQAKQLKEAFNSKYPDYVYRRRPNNSRKRRRTEGGVTRTPDNLNINPNDLDLSGSEILGDSPVEENGFTDGLADLQYPNEPSHAFAEHSFASQSRGSPYAYSSEISRAVDSPDNRVTYMAGSTHEQLSQLPSTSPAPTRVTDSHYPYISAQNHSHSQAPSNYSADQNVGQTNWESRVGKGRMVPANWPASPRPFPSQWQTAGSAAQINSSNTVACQGSIFPTLNSPFFPNPPQSDGDFSHATSSSSVYSETSSQYTTSQNPLHGSDPQSRPVSQYDSRSYTSSPSIRNINGYVLDPDRDSHLYPQPHARSTLPRPLPPLQAIAPFPQNTHSPSSAATIPISSKLSFWSRDNKLDE